MKNVKTILITGAGSGFAEAAAIGMAKAGHNIIATAQISPQVAALRNKVANLGLDNIRVEKLDLHDPYDVAFAQSLDIDILWNNAGMGETGPVSEIPLDLVRRNFETNVFKPLELTQGFIAKWIKNKKQAKIVFTSSMGGLFTPGGFGTYVSTKHALESIAEAIAQEVTPFGIKVQTINPGAYLTGFNETMADTAFRWLDDSKNFTKRDALRATFDELLASPQGHLDPQEMIDRMIAIVPADTGKFRNVCPQFVEDMLKEAQTAAWTAEI
ncbi:TPA: SDR family oxidoreductase [Acinetobacter baumannii]|uniref:SDR family oxidoreductase n=1 Tax=Acinetobacter calcoaceticus/baumannii complex TaxID=909768 RepID=UPI00083E180D|nr:MULTISPECIES: SDR family oxidoreductase [Acinetobacter calcoaceticus/baumannii complex]EKV4707728.1 SDR family oxidoreductase [Acinetobacter baumannii]MBN6514753.1 SDR family oxidoreductase [Acinetobacter pittii]MCK0914260.1 SDR family oxidoreductase [Acinetobacter pittii]MDA4923333.1 SDR family oxidoreductase [Acinetobacter baumannii]MDH2520677.1 SDR family oxidoreductase [Acinetobacter baumannii]